MALGQPSSAARRSVEALSAGGTVHCCGPLWAECMGDLLVAIVGDDAAEFGDGLHQVLKTVVPVGGDFKEEHDALMGEAELEIADLADVFDEVLGIFYLFDCGVGEAVLAELVEEDGDVCFFEDDFAHCDEGCAGRFCVLDEVLPAVGVFFFEDHGGDFFCDKCVESAHAVAGDERHHVVFERDKIVGLHQAAIVSESWVHRTLMFCWIHCRDESMLRRLDRGESH
jgi:hypothetical protein